MHECLKITIRESDPKSKIGGFFGTLYREDGKTIVKELWGMSKRWVVEDLGYHAKWYNENVLNEKTEKEESEPGNEASEEGTSEKD